MPPIVTQTLKTMLAAVAVVVVLTTLSLAQGEPPRKSPLGEPAGTQSAARTAPSAGAAAGPLDRLWIAIVETQRDLTNAMTGAVKRLKSSGSTSSTALLAFLSFLYGVLHAVGPGHGKFVISSYALANERTVRRGIVLSFMAATVQAISAIAIVGAFAILIRATSLQMRATEAWLETASWALIAALGGWLLWRQVRVLKPQAVAAASAPAADHHHGRHGYGHDHQHDESCGHLHLPPPGALGGAWSWPQAWSLALSIGIRPCTGAIAVLLFALSVGMFWAGVFATFAMAIGTALTVSILAAIAVGSRELASRIAGRESRWGTRIEQAAGIAGAALVLAIGTTFFIASLWAPPPL